MLTILVQRGEHRRGRADLWSLGCIFGEMLGGKPVFNGSSTLDTVRRRVTVEPTAVRAGNERGDASWNPRPRVRSAQARLGAKLVEAAAHLLPVPALNPSWP